MQSKAQSSGEEPFISLTDANYRHFPRVKAMVSKYAEKALEKLYARIDEHSGTASILPAGPIREHARSAQLNHWQELFSGAFDKDALVRSERIGEVHARVGLQPSFYIGAYALVLEDIINHALGSGLMPGRSGSVIGTLVKTALLDMSAALSSYFEAEEQARMRTINTVGEALAKVATGDLSVQLDHLPENFSRMSEDFHNMRWQFSEIISQMADAANSVNTGAGEISAAASDLSDRTERQAEVLARTSEVMKHITEGVRTTASNAKQVNESVSEVNVQAHESGAIVEKAIVAMDKIKTSSNEIASITEVIEAIAFQTNLLALNAGVEAARAGDAGKGFAVVASEVRALAHRTTESAKDIKALISKSSDDVKQGVDLVGRTGNALEQIISTVSQATAQAQEISSLAIEQAENLQAVSAEIEQMDFTTQQNAAMVEESNAAARNLSNEAGVLTTIVGRFSLERRSRFRGEKSDKGAGTGDEWRDSGPADDQDGFFASAPRRAVNQ